MGVYVLDDTLFDRVILDSNKPKEIVFISGEYDDSIITCNTNGTCKVAGSPIEDFNQWRVISTCMFVMQNGSKFVFKSEYESKNEALRNKTNSFSLVGS